MEKFTPQTLKKYLEEKVLPKLGLYDSVGIIEEASGGLSSAVFRVQLNNDFFFVKQILEGMTSGLGELPDDLKILFSDNRQKYEEKAIKIFNNVVGKNIAPNIVYFEPNDKILILSDVAGTSGKLFENVFENSVNEIITDKLAKISADLTNKTYEKYPYLRSSELDKEIRKVKLKYIYGDVFSNLKSTSKELEQRINKFISFSVNHAKVVCHGDYHPKNIILRTNNEIGLIDFEEAIVHDPVWDISALLAHYLLRALNYPNDKEKYKNLSLLLIEKFFDYIKIPEKIDDLKFRINNYTAGWMMLRVDGITKAKWITDENIKNEIRNTAKRFIVENLSINELIESL